MFSGYARLLLRLVLIFLGIWLVARMRVFVLVLAWLVIFGCLWIVWVKRYSKNRKLRRRVDECFVKFTKSRFHKWVVKTGKNLEEDAKKARKKKGKKRGG